MATKHGSVGTRCSFHSRTAAGGGAVHLAGVGAPGASRARGARCGLDWWWEWAVGGEGREALGATSGKVWVGMLAGTTPHAQVLSWDVFGVRV